MKCRIRNTLAAVAFAAAVVTAGSAVAQPNIACSFEGQTATVERRLGGTYEVWECFAGDWYFVQLCNRDGTCQAV